MRTETEIREMYNKIEHDLNTKVKSGIALAELSLLRWVLNDKQIDDSKFEVNNEGVI